MIVCSCESLNQNPTVLKFKNGSCYEVNEMVVYSISWYVHTQGNISNGMLHGRGVYKWADGTIYEVKLHIICCSNNTSFIDLHINYTSFFRENSNITPSQVLELITGQMEGTINTLNISCFITHSWYEGQVLNGLRHGHGTYQCSDQKTSYTGQWVNGQRHGKVPAGISVIRFHVTRVKQFMTHTGCVTMTANGEIM